MKLIKNITVFFLIVFIIGFGIIYVLEPTNKVKSSETLSNLGSSDSINFLDKELINNVKYSGGSLYADINIDNDLLLSVMNQYAGNSEELKNGSYKISGNNILAKIPTKIGPIDSQLDLIMSISTSESKLIISIDGAKLGKISIPNFILEKYLSEYIKDNTLATVSDNKITITLPEQDINIENIAIVNNQITTTISIANEKIFQLGGSLLSGFLG